jgi:hypothetical protein
VSEAPSLDEIGLETGTDKASSHHGYLDFYDRFFEKLRGRPVRILEIGVLQGASVKMWETYFPYGLVIGADINPDVVRFESKRIKIEIIDQSNIQNLIDLGVKHGPFDVIVEDGSHLWEHQITSLRTLFPFLKDKGFYIVEDLQTNFGDMIKNYRGVSTISCVDYLKQLVDLRVATAQADIAKEEDPFLRTYGRSVGFVAFYKHACLIEKRLESKATPPQINKEPLTEIDPAGIYPFQIFAHVGQLGDVRDNGSASVNIKPGKDCDIQGFRLLCSAKVQDQVRYRGRQPGGLWTSWVTGNEFAGSYGKSIPLSGYSVEIRGQLEEQFDLSAVGAFGSGKDLVTVRNGEDCVPRKDGACLHGMQIIVKPRMSFRG